MKNDERSIPPRKCFFQGEAEAKLSKAIAKTLQQCPLVRGSLAPCSKDPSNLTSFSKNDRPTKSPQKPPFAKKKKQENTSQQKKTPGKEKKKH